MTGGIGMRAINTEAMGEFCLLIVAVGAFIIVVGAFLIVLSMILEKLL
jgi:hypothetical protein